VTSGGDDPALRRFERDGLLVCLSMAVLALAAVGAARGPGAGAKAAAGVLGGGLLTGFSYRAIKGAAEIVSAAAGSAPPAPAEAGEAASEAPVPGAAPAAGPALSTGRRAFLAVKFFTRYALLAVAAYAMLTCFRLHPIAVLAGALTPFLAAVVQICRLSCPRRPPL
jgi:hypothetical protein